MTKTLINGAREKILAGAGKLAGIVKLTLGPKGRNVIIDRLHAEPLITNDGVTIAREFKLEDPFENLGARVLLGCSIKTNETAGDGTTSAIVFGESLLKLGGKQISLGASPVLIKEGMTAAAEFLVSEIEKHALPAEGKDKIFAIAANSCASKTDGKTVAEAFERLGKNGIISVEENSLGQTTLSFTEGLEINTELASPYFCEDPVNQKTVFEDAGILVTEQKISSIKEILPVLEHTFSNKQPLVIIAEDFSADVVAALIVNRVRAGVRVAALRCVRLGERKDAILGDIAALTGATLGVGIENLGTCQKVVCGMSSAKFISAGHDKLQNRIEQIKGQINAADDEYNKTRLAERLAKLTNGVAVISVGCATEIEQKERKLRIEDAVAAARAAIEEGIVAGGGLAYIRLEKPLESHIKTLPAGQRIGARVVLESLPAVMCQIAINAGACPDVVLEKIRNGRKGFGFNALNSKYCDLAAFDIIDPAKVIKSVIRNAVSAVGTLLTTEAIIANVS